MERRLFQITLKILILFFASLSFAQEGQELSEEEELQREYEQAQKEQKELREKLKKMQDPNSEKMDLSKIDPKELMAMMKTVSSYYKPMKESEIQKLMVEDVENKEVKTYLENSKLTLFAARLLKDEKAMPALALILHNKKKLYLFLGINVLLFFVFFRMRDKQKRKVYMIENFVARTIYGSFYFFQRMILSMTLRLGIFIYLFHHSVQPTIEIFKKTFL